MYKVEKQYPAACRVDVCCGVVWYTAKFILFFLVYRQLDWNINDFIDDEGCMTWDVGEDGWMD